MGKGNVRVGADAPGAGDESSSNRAAARAPEIRRLLLGAYDAEKRDLPWRGESDPYRIWVSEVMLQQTRVETVIPYYKEWVTRFPSLETLAMADEEEVLRAWQGLGYYSRARNLHGAARVVRERLGGALPGSYLALRALPGVGEYTAGAVASIAFGEAVPAVDGNARRVLSRIFDLPAPAPRVIRNLAGTLVDPARPGDFNQALMELGSRICTPRSPGCERCPVASLCLARERGSVEDRPGARVRRPPKEVDLVVLVGVVVGPGSPRFLVRKRPPTGLLAGLWEFPTIEVEPGEGALGRALEWAREPGILGEGELPGEEMEKVAVEGGVSLDSSPGGPAMCRRLDSVEHLFTHLRARYHPFLIRLSGERGPLAGGRYVSLEELEKLPVPVAQRRILDAAMAAMAADGG
ncbi:MAG: A/G-specific adenine glycosylase [Gemmatimonadota bacterium]|jgi:A/G-specific adenine glycosylase